jgi:type IV pilus assembly protein PilA
LARIPGPASVATSDEGERRMCAPSGRDRGFTLVELMVVVLVIGILVTIAVPVYADASAQAQSKGCLANQKTIDDAVALYIAGGTGPTTSTQGELAPSGSGWYAFLVPGWIKSAPTCPLGQTYYLMDTHGNVIGDQGSTPGFKLPTHVLP